MLKQAIFVLTESECLDFVASSWDSRDSRIIPQAVSVRYGLAIGAACSPLVLGMMYLFGLLHPLAGMDAR
jgi:hypothetical protein